MTPDQSAKQIAEAVANALEASGGGSAYIAAVAIVVFGAIACLWILKVAIPESANRSKQTEVLAVQGQVISGIAEKVIESNKVSADTFRMMLLIIAVDRVVVRAFEDISDKANVDLSSHIGEIRGILNNSVVNTEKR